MEALKLQLASRTLLNGSAPQWQRVPATRLALRGTEARAQPSQYIRASWAGKRIGSVRTLLVQAARNRERLFFRLEWPDSTQNLDYGEGTAFPDAAAVLFPQNGDVPLRQMGSPAAGIDAWRWRANRQEGEALAYHGFATEEPQPGPSVATTARWQDGRWLVVIGGPMAVADSYERVAFAIWDGGNQERAGLHSYSPRWLELEAK